MGGGRWRARGLCSGGGARGRPARFLPRRWGSGNDCGLDPLARVWGAGGDRAQVMGYVVEPAVDPDAGPHSPGRALRQCALCAPAPRRTFQAGRQGGGPVRAVEPSFWVALAGRGVAPEERDARAPTGEGLIGSILASGRIAGRNLLPHKRQATSSLVIDDAVTDPGDLLVGGGGVGAGPVVDPVDGGGQPFPGAQQIVRGMPAGRAGTRWWCGSDRSRRSGTGPGRPRRRL